MAEVIRMSDLKESVMSGVESEDAMSTHSFTSQMSQKLTPNIQQTHMDRQVPITSTTELAHSGKIREDTHMSADDSEIVFKQRLPDKDGFFSPVEDIHQHVQGPPMAPHRQMDDEIASTHGSEMTHSEVDSVLDTDDELLAQMPSMKVHFDPASDSRPFPPASKSNSPVMSDVREKTGSGQTLFQSTPRQNVLSLRPPHAQQEEVRGFSQWRGDPVTMPLPGQRQEEMQQYSKVSSPIWRPPVKALMSSQPVLVQSPERQVRHTQPFMGKSEVQPRQSAAYSDPTPRSVGHSGFHNDLPMGRNPQMAEMSMTRGREKGRGSMVVHSDSQTASAAQAKKSSPKMPKMTPRSDRSTSWSKQAQDGSNMTRESASYTPSQAPAYAQGVPNVTGGMYMSPQSGTPYQPSAGQMLHPHGRNPVEIYPNPVPPQRRGYYGYLPQYGQPEGQTDYGSSMRDVQVPPNAYMATGYDPYVTAGTQSHYG